MFAGTGGTEKTTLSKFDRKQDREQRTTSE
jgi:hypothetical protein